MNQPATNEVKTVRKLLAGRLKRAEFERTIYCVEVEDGTAYEDIFQPEYWAHVGAKLKPCDRIEVTFYGDDARLVELVVVDAAPLWAKVVEKSNTSFVDSIKEITQMRQESVDNSEYEVVWGSPAIKYCIVRKSDKERIFSGIASKEQAQSDLNEYVKTLAA